MAVPKQYLPKNCTPRLKVFALMKELPETRLGPIIECLKKGMTRVQAFGAAGLSTSEMDCFMTWGELGFEPWVELFEQVKINENSRMKRIMQRDFKKAEDGDEAAMIRVMKLLSPEAAEVLFRPREAELPPGHSGFNFNVNVIKTFEPGSSGPALESGEIVDAEYEEN